ncbi:MAG: 1,4-dihydroxy-6-naphthoate synthase [Bacteroidota bacterium]|nr:1,4-dihydroxy-6-naphthoate synthase [Bacteroidota bacterium]
MPKIKLAFSPCPNDTFIFDAIVHEKIDLENLSFDYRLEDVETLNHLAMEGRMDMIKVSYHAYLYLLNTYCLLNSGSALGFGNGPLVISGKPFQLEDLPGLTIAVPGEFTTANLLLSIIVPEARMKRIMVFDEIEDSVLSGKTDAGVIIHENRFTYKGKGLFKIADLGEHWERLMHLPIPLGGIITKKSLGFETINKLNRIMRRSVEYAMSHPEDTMEFVRANAKEMDETVMKKHIGLYVNDYTLDLGDEGKKAIQKLIMIHENKASS